MFDRALEKCYLICWHDSAPRDCTTPRLYSPFPCCVDDCIFWLVEKNHLLLIFKRDIMLNKLDKL